MIVANAWNSADIDLHDRMVWHRIDILSRVQITNAERIPAKVGVGGHIEAKVLELLGRARRLVKGINCLLYTSTSPRDKSQFRMPSCA